MAVVLVLALDFLRFLCLNIRLTRLEVVATDPDASESVSEELDELELSDDDDDEFMRSWRTPGCDSSSTMCCGVLSYM